MNLVLVPVDTNSHSLLDVSRGHGIRQIDHELRKLLHVDVFRVVRVRIYDFRASGHLEWLLVLKGLLIGCQVPQCGCRESRVALLDPRQLVHLLYRRLDVVVDLFDGLVVLTLAVCFQ